MKLVTYSMVSSGHVSSRAAHRDINLIINGSGGVINTHYAFESSKLTLLSAGAPSEGDLW